MIQLQSLNLTIHGKPVLHDVTLDVLRGRVTGLAGESGSGKSMTALAMMGLLPQGAQLTGQILLGDEDIAKAPDARMRALRGRRIGMIFQEPMSALNPVMTIGAQVAETLTIHGQASARAAWDAARAVLDRVGLAQIGMDRYPHELSGGQRQRVCIAAAIALRPDLLIADEPTTALDVTTQGEILSLLENLVQVEGMGLLLITHDLGVMARMADHLAVMEAGEIRETGAAATLLRHPQAPITQALVAATRPKRRNIAPKSAPLPILTVEGARRLYAPRRPILGLRPKPEKAHQAALDGVSFDLMQGECLAVVGESGSGKSTLARALLGLERLDGGRISAFGQTISPEMGRDLRKRISIVFQDPYGSFNPRWRVERILCEPFFLSHPRPDPELSRAAMRRALSLVGLPEDAAGAFAHEFSGGQRQRIAIARALIANPDIVILDEAVSALDLTVRGRILDLLVDLQDQLSLSYLFITHDFAVVRAMAERVLVMRAGRVVEAGPVAQILQNPQDAYTKALLGATLDLPMVDDGATPE